MIEQFGDFWSTEGDAHVITTNGDVNSQGRAVMGRGIALQAKNRFPGIDLQLGRLLTHRGNHVHYLGRWTRADGVSHTIFTFPVKHHYFELADTELIVQSAAELILECAPSYQKVVMVRPGCGNGGLQWNDVKERLKHFFNNRFVILERKEE